MRVVNRLDDATQKEGQPFKAELGFYTGVDAYRKRSSLLIRQPLMLRSTMCPCSFDPILISSTVAVVSTWCRTWVRRSRLSCGSTFNWTVLARARSVDSRNFLKRRLLARCSLRLAACFRGHLFVRLFRCLMPSQFLSFGGSGSLGEFLCCACLSSSFDLADYLRQLLTPPGDDIYEVDPGQVVLIGPLDQAGKAEGDSVDLERYLDTGVLCHGKGLEKAQPAPLEA